MYTKLSYGLVHATGRFDADRQKQTSSYMGNALYLYGEYGLGDDVTVTFLIPLVQHNRDPAREFVTGHTLSRSTTAALAGDYYVNGKLALLRQPALSLQLGLKVPALYDIERQPTLGTGYVDAEAKLLAGVSLHPINGYVTAEAGYRKRFGDYSDEVPFSLEGGYMIADVVYLQALLDGVFSTGEATTATTTGIFSTSEDRLRVGGGLIYPLPIDTPVQIGVQIGATYYKTVYGVNTLDAHEVFVGVAYEYRPEKRE